MSFDFVAHFVAHPALADAIVAPHPDRAVQHQVAADIAAFVPFAVVSPPRFADHAVPAPVLGSDIWGGI